MIDGVLRYSSIGILALGLVSPALGESVNYQAQTSKEAGRQVAVDTQALKEALERMLNQLNKLEKKSALRVHPHPRNQEGVRGLGGTIRIVSPHSPGGASDFHARLVARHLGKHLPGKPEVIVVNVPGRGGRAAVAYAANKTRGGVTVLQPTGSTLQRQLFDDSDLASWAWLGSINEKPILVVPRNSQFQSLNSQMPELNVHCTLPGTANCSAAAAVAEARDTTTIVSHEFHARIQERLASNAGVIWSSRERRLAKRGARAIAYFGMDRHPDWDIAGVPFLEDGIAGKATTFRLLALPVIVPHAWGVPPGAAPDAIQVLRRGFLDLMDAPQFAAAGQRASLAISPGKRLAQWIENLEHEMTPAAVTRAIRAKLRLGRATGIEPAVPSPSLISFPPCMDGPVVDPLHRPWKRTPRPCI